MDIRWTPEALMGLDGDEVRLRRESGRQNTPPERVTKTTGQIFRDNVCTLFNLFNLLIAVALALVGAWSNMLFMAIIVLNTLIGVAQELHAKHLVDRLSLLNAPASAVIREGRRAEIPVQELVADDVVELTAGAQVSADCVILGGEMKSTSRCSPARPSPCCAARASTCSPAAPWSAACAGPALNTSAGRTTPPA